MHYICFLEFSFAVCFSPFLLKIRLERRLQMFTGCHAPRQVHAALHCILHSLILVEHSAFGILHSLILSLFHSAFCHLGGAFCILHSLIISFCILSSWWSTDTMQIALLRRAGHTTEKNRTETTIRKFPEIRNFK